MDTNLFIKTQQYMKQQELFSNYQGVFLRQFPVMNSQFITTQIDNSVFVFVNTKTFEFFIIVV